VVNSGDWPINHGNRTLDRRHRTVNASHRLDRRLDNRPGACDFRARRDQFEQGLTMAIPFEPEPDEVGPIALEDHQRAVIVPPPNLAHFVVPLVDHAELLAFLVLFGDLEIDADVQVLLRPSLGCTGIAVARRVEPGNRIAIVGNMPRRFLRNRDGRLLAHGHHCAQQQEKAC
jgi:hypothetical protein